MITAIKESMVYMAMIFVAITCIAISVNILLRGFDAIAFSILIIGCVAYISLAVYLPIFLSKDEKKEIHVDKNGNLSMKYTCPICTAEFRQGESMDAVAEHLEKCKKANLGISSR